MFSISCLESEIAVLEQTVNEPLLIQFSSQSLCNTTIAEHNKQNVAIY